MWTSLFALSLAATPSGVTVDGNQLLLDGKKTVLRGVCTGDVILARKDRPLSDYRVIAKDWNANVVRIGVAPTSWRNEVRSYVLGELKREVAAARRAGMVVIIDWHAISWPDGYAQIPTWEGSAKDLYDGSMDLALDFWRTCAREFRRDQRVAFQLWCEPVKNAEDWKTPKGSTWPELKVHMKRLTDAIRDAGASNLVLASGNQWAYDMNGIRQSLLPDKNTAYEWHVYAGHGNNNPKEWADMLDRLHEVAPVVVTEWGFQEDTTGHFKGTQKEFGDPFLRFIEDRGMSWTAWCWHPSWGPPMLEKDWRTPNSFGRFVRDALGRLNK